MFITTLLVLTSLLPRIDTAVDFLRLEASRARAAMTGAAVPGVSPVFVPEERAVSNWREEAGAALRPSSLALVVRYAAAEPAFVARCVKLNNYWCIKRARWQGEIGADAEGHTGFATAADGADAAALLLRRYYREFGRRNALAIVRRWAPAECRIAGSVASAGKMPVGKVSTGLAPMGLGRTVRARFLARRARGGVPRRILSARGAPMRIQPWSPLARMTAPSKLKHIHIAAATGVVTVTQPLAPERSTIMTSPADILAKSSTVSATARLAERFAKESAALPSIAAGLPNIPLLDLTVPAPLCGNDEVRIRNYATRIAASVGLKVEDDLALFDGEGRPTPHLGPVMLAMSGVELGTLRAGTVLVAGAIGRLIPRATDAAE